ncbi:uncharacterized protein Triagg1_3997 [Trichoderma aggressivum f. europaeum]|uniref:Subtilisin-like serine protease n=1 Tax=Trichoderma aggressivum f. europaeum TaxID=173218 RepID=A0AAE1IGI7_9HYPO|nr:hypothetical protein Triagg1_3997 [Trichoderma aggressivum f. europaeum]
MMDADTSADGLERRVDSTYGIPIGPLSNKTTLVEEPRSPPFSSKEDISKEAPLIAGIYQRDKKVVSIDKSDPASIKEYLEYNLDVRRLNEIHKHLWLAGLPQACRALHDQVRIGRQIHISEMAHLHLVWRDNILYLKPLPDYLLSCSFWTEKLCADRELFESAKGFLYSYTWLICSKSDLKIALEKGLVSEKITWEKWVPFSAAVVSSIKGDLSDINPRYVYGELRLTRLNAISRFCTNTIKFRTMIRGYDYGYRQYSTYLERNFKWVLTAFIYITVVLAAMQVGLATTKLNENAIFNRASYVFTMFSILAPIISLTIGSFFILVLIVFNLRYALSRRATSHKEFAGAFGNESLQAYGH